MKIIRYLKFTFLHLFIFLNCFFAQENENRSKPQMKALRIDESFELTGKLDNPNWAKSEPVDLDVEFRPGDNIPAPQKTTVRALYDDSFLYFGIECFDTNPEEIRANITDRDKMFSDDFVVIVFDTYGDYQRAYEFAVNPYGIQGDLLATETGEDESIDWIWHSEASINENGWTAEIAIPFTSLSFPEKDIQTWALSISRSIPRSSRIQTSWTRIERDVQGFITQGGLLTGIENIKQTSLIELLPYAIGQQTGKLPDSDDPRTGIKYDKFQGRIGGGIKYSPNSNFSLDAVINPDFSQIESDAAQISVNTTFALEYEEKRPFFLIGGGLLRQPMYYSRSINDPLGAARIMGKSGKLSYLYMGAYDRNTVFVVPGDDESNTVATSLKSYANIGKLRYDFGDEDYIGTLLMSRNLSGGHNYLAGFDWNYKFWNNWYFGGEVFLSQTKELNDTSVLSEERKFGNTKYNAALNGENYSGGGIHMTLNRTEKSYYFGLTLNDFTPTYQTYNGLFPLTGYRQLNYYFTFVRYPEISFINELRFGSSFNLEFNYDNIKREQYIQPYLSIWLKGQTYFNTYFFLSNDERFKGTYFTKINRIGFVLTSKPINEISLSINGEVGKFIHYSDDPSVGYGHDFNAELTLQPTSKLNITLSYARGRLSDNITEELFYDGNIYRAVGVYQFTHEIFLRTIFQYDSFEKIYQLYPLFSYKLNAFTTFFAGATSDYLDYKNHFGIRNTDRQYFLKLQYLIGV